MATWNKIATPEEYKVALQRVDELIDVELSEATHNELMLVSFLIEAYEDEQYPIRDATPLQVLKFMMEMKEIKQQDLIPILGSKGNVSKILSGKTKIQLEDIYPLSTLLGIPAEALIPRPENDYAEVEVITEYVAPVTLQLKEHGSRIPLAMEEDSTWGKTIREPEELLRRKPKVKS